MAGIRLAPSGKLATAFWAAGFAATSAQVLLLRELLVSSAGDEASIGVGLAAWLLGIAFGASFTRRLSPPLASRLAIPSLALLAISSGAASAAGRILRTLWAPPAGELPGLGLVLGLAGATLLPAGLLVGAAFTALATSTSRLLPPDVALLRLYVYESLGSLAGGLLATLLVGTAVGPLPAALAAGLLAAILCYAAAGDDLLGGGRALAASIAVLGVALVLSPRIDRATERARFAGTSPGTPFIASADTPYGHLVLGGGDVKYLYESGQYAASFPDPYGSETLAHLAGSLCDRPLQVLSLAGIERGPLPFLLRHGIRRLTLLEPDTRALAFVGPYLGAEERRALADPRVTIVQDDPRRFLSRKGETFDLILLLAPDPVTLARARLTTAEFFRSCAARLAPRGTLVLSLRTAPAALTGETAALAGSVYGPLRQAFPVVHMTPGPESLLVAGFDPVSVTLDPAVLAARFAARGIEAPSFAPQLFPALLPPGRVAQLEASLVEASRTVDPSRDDRPVSFLYALARRQLETGSVVGRAVAALDRLPPAVLGGLVLLPSIWFALRAIGRAPLHRAAGRAVAATGAAGMTWSLLLLLSFQTREGVLYGALGVLTAAFMPGLALGALAARWAIRSRSVEPRRALTGAVLAAVGTGLAIAFAIPALSLLRAAPTAVVLGAHASLLFLAGAATGGLYPVAVSCLLACGMPAGGTAGRFETADHAGAAAAALLGATLLVPVFGLRGTAFLAAAVLALTAIDVARSGPASPRFPGSS